MLELADALLPVLREGDAVAVVTVTAVARSAPRGEGAAMAVLRDGRVIGSISGGCVEGDAVMLATEVLLTGRARSARLGFSDDAAHAAGLACGGSVDVVVHRIAPGDAVAVAALERAARGEPVAVGIVLPGPAASGDGGRVVASDVLPDQPRGSCILPAAYNGADVFFLRAEAPPRLVIVGAGEHAMALSRVAASAGFEVVVCDVWERLVSAERFPDAVHLLVGVPAEQLEELIGAGGPGVAVCVLTHDERVDVPALAAALRADVGFVGAMGARSTVARRAELLRKAGLRDDELARLHSPLGLDLGGSSPGETALAVLAEIVAARHSATARPLRELRGPLHPRVAPSTPAAPYRTQENRPAPDGSPTCAAAPSGALSRST